MLNAQSSVCYSSSSPSQRILHTEQVHQPFSQWPTSETGRSATVSGDSIVLVPTSITPSSTSFPRIASITETSTPDPAHSTETCFTCDFASSGRVLLYWPQSLFCPFHVRAAGTP